MFAAPRALFMFAAPRALRLNSYIVVIITMFVA